MELPNSLPPDLFEGSALLLEFVNADQFPGRVSHVFPMLAGSLADGGARYRWVRFAVSTVNMMTHGRDEITLEEADMEVLLGVVRELRPKAVILTDALYEPQARSVREASPGVTFFGADFEAEGLRPLWINAQTLIDGVTQPRYVFEPGNRAARSKTVDNFYLVTKEACGHKADAWLNQRYATVEGERDTPHPGCAFCLGSSGSPGAGASGADDRGRVLRQLEALAAQRRPVERLPNALLLERVVGNDLLGHILRAMDDLGLAGHVQLLLAARTDRVPRIEEAIAAHAESSPRSNFRLGVHACGVESFAQSDLELFNKNTTTLDGLRAINSLRRLAGRYPGRFRFSGVSFLLFSPWTTLESLQQTLSVARLMEIGRTEAGNIFQSRMRLHEGLPVTALARQEGLLVEEEADPVVIMNRRKLFSFEWPWRFADPRVRPISRLALRFDLLETETGDALVAELLGALRDINEQWTPGHDLDLLDLLLSMIEAARASKEPLSERELSSRAVSIRRREIASATAPRRHRLGERLYDLSELCALLAPLAGSNGKPVLSVDGVTQDELSTFAAPPGLHYSFSGGRLLLSRDPDLLSEAVALESRADTESIERLGRLHGLPSCCVSAFARMEEPPAGRLEWAAYETRLRHPGAVSAHAHPLWSPALCFIPCSLDCECAAETWRSWFELVGAPPPANPGEVHVVDIGPCSVGELVRLPDAGGDEPNVISYEPRRLTGDGRLRERLSTGDELHVLPGQLQVHREGRLVDSLPSWVVPWSAGGAWHEEEYEQLAAAVDDIRQKRSRRTRRLLLLEFVTNERWVYDSRFFPFIKGGAEAHGFEARWVYFGGELRVESGQRNEDTSYEQYMDVVSSDVDELATIARDFRPTHVISSHPPSGRILEALRAGDVEPALLCMSDMPCPEGGLSLPRDILERGPRVLREDEAGPRDVISLKRLGGDLVSWRMARTDWLLEWLGVSETASEDHRRFMVGTFRPSYRATACNEQAGAHAPHLLVLGGVACDHFSLVADDPRYAGLDLSECEHVRGCAYCTWYRGPNSDMHVDPVAIAEEQLRSIASSIEEDQSRYQGHIDLLDIRLFSKIERFVEMVTRLNLPPTVFYFEPRVDRLVRLAPRLERALAKLAGTGHSICLFRMGAENLVEEENLLFNKSVGFEQLRGGTEILRGLAERHPDTFDYDPTWGYITCSPWTTLEMIETTIERAISLGFDPRGVWLYTPLLLFGGAPITKLAEAEGLISERFADLSMLWEPAINGCPADALRPWRFIDRRTQTAFSLIVRFTAAALRHKYPDTLFHEDETYRRLLAGEGLHGPFGRPDLFAREVIAVVKAAPERTDLVHLMDEALVRYERLPDREALEDRPGDASASRGSSGAKRADSAEETKRNDESAPLERWARDFGRVWKVVCRRVDGHLGRVSGGEVRVDPSSRAICTTVSFDDHQYDLRIEALEAGRPCLLRSEHFALSHGKDTPPRNETDKQRLARLLRIIDAAAVEHVPGALPPAPPPR